MKRAVESSIMDLLQPEVVTQEPGRAELRFSVRPEFTIPSGALQGGIIAGMLDMAMAFASERVLSTASLNVEMFRPVRGPVVTVVANIPREGRRIIFAEAEMRNETGEVVARGTQTAIPVD